MITFFVNLSDKNDIKIQKIGRGLYASLILVVILSAKNEIVTMYKKASNRNKLLNFTSNYSMIDMDLTFLYNIVVK